MSIDLEKLKKRLLNVESRYRIGDEKSSVWWNPPAPKEVGQSLSYVIRMLPDPNGDPFRDFFFHYRVGNAKSVLCPKRNFKQKCAICDFSFSLWNEKDPALVEAAKVEAKQLFPTGRYFSVIVLRNKDGSISGPRVWGYSKKVYESILKRFYNAKWGDLSDPVTGRDIEVTITKGVRFNTTEVEPSPEQSPLMPSGSPKGALEELIKSVPNVEDLQEHKTEAEIEKILEDYANTRSDGETKKYAADDEMSSGEAVDRAFFDLEKA